MDKDIADAIERDVALRFGDPPHYVSLPWEEVRPGDRMVMTYPFPISDEQRAALNGWVRSSLTDPRPLMIPVPQVYIVRGASSLCCKQTGINELTIGADDDGDA
jgi:hypothetical protein